MDYRQALDYWFGRTNYEQRTPRPDDLRLDRMRLLLRRLGDPHRRLRIVHVAGSKGKGSTSALLASVLRRAGYRTGLFTSPHLTRVEERIQVDGEPVTPDELAALMDDVRGAVDGGGPELAGVTFFEIATAVGFLHFARRRVDVAVIEVGLGGRFDSTNVCRPLVAVITSISFDHWQQLGNRLASIAREKAGIVKPGRPVVSGATAPEARDVIREVCRRRRALLEELGRDFTFEHEPGQVVPVADPAGRPVGYTVGRPRVRVCTRRRQWPTLEVGLLGRHQAANAAVAVVCVERLRDQGLHVPDDAVAAGLADVHWPARMEVFGGRPLTVLDCAHNDASCQALVETLHESFPAARRLLIFAASRDKDLPGMVRLLAPHFAHVFFTRYGNSLRGVQPAELAELVPSGAGPRVSVCPTPADAWHAARAAAGPEDLVCVTGSVFLAGELRPLVLAGETARSTSEV